MFLKRQHEACQRERVVDQSKHAAVNVSGALSVGYEAICCWKSDDSTPSGETKPYGPGGSPLS